jgi:hypothetical protein
MSASRFLRLVARGLLAAALVAVCLTLAGSAPCDDPVTAFEWSPDGSRLAIAVNEAGILAFLGLGPSRIYMVDVPDKEECRAAGPAVVSLEARDIAWTPDGTSLFGSGNVFDAPFTGTPHAKVVRFDPKLCETLGEVEGWFIRPSPDGTRRAYVQASSSQAEGVEPPCASALFVSKMDGSEQARVSASQSVPFLWTCAWSPSGSCLAWTEGHDSPLPPHGPRLTLQVASVGEAAFETRPRWLSDRLVAYARPKFKHPSKPTLSELLLAPTPQLEREVVEYDVESRTTRVLASYTLPWACNYSYWLCGGSGLLFESARRTGEIARWGLASRAWSVIASSDRRLKVRPNPARAGLVAISDGCSVWLSDLEGHRLGTVYPPKQGGDEGAAYHE